MKSSTVLAAVCGTVVLAAVVCGARNQPRETAGATKWEYRIESYARLSGLVSLGEALTKARTVEELEALQNDMASRMTDLGRQGWELVCLEGNRGLVFKRKIP
jgi:hypothetical protein